MAVENTKNLAVRAFVRLAIISLINVASPAWSNHEHLRNEVNLFQDLLRSQPKVSTALRANPKLVNNKKYLDKHDELAKFLQLHPDVKRELVNHPSRIFGNYYRGDQGYWNHHR